MSFKVGFGAQDRKKLFFLASVFVPVLIVDQFTKFLIHTRFRWGQSYTLISGFFDLTYVRNTGAAFGLLRDASPNFREPFFIFLPILVVAVLLFVYWRSRPSDGWNALGLVLVLSGAIGNLVDRLRLGYVIDFLDFHYAEVYHFPSFNVADSCICVGIGILFLLSGRPMDSSAPLK